MTLRSRLTVDNQRIIGGDDMDVLTLYNAAGSSYTAKGRITDVGINFTPQGLPIAGKKWSVCFHISDLSSIISDTETETFEGWQGEFTNSEGETVQGRFNNPMIDKTFGYVVATLTKNKAGVTP